MKDFKEYISKNVEVITESGCWIWLLRINTGGYGVFGYKDGMASKNARIHRKSYQVFVGDIPEGMHVLHTCDVRCCCNPAHLWIGTHKQNMADKCAKGRHRNRYTGKDKSLNHKRH